MGDEEQVPTPPDDPTTEPDDNGDDPDPEPQPHDDEPILFSCTETVATRVASSKDAPAALALDGAAMATMYAQAETGVMRFIDCTGAKPGDVTTQGWPKKPKLDDVSKAARAVCAARLYHVHAGAGYATIDPDVLASALRAAYQDI